MDPITASVLMPCSSQADHASSRQHWQCISGCGACCRLDPSERGEAIEALDAHQRELYLSMVGADGWCIHFDTGGRRCRIYDQRPDFCRVENLMSLFGSPNQGEQAPASPSQANQDGQLDQRRGAKAPEQAKDLEQVAQLQATLELQAANELAISCCKQQIRSEYGGRGRVMRRFLRAIRQQP